jgi:hypothetical protein
MKSNADGSLPAPPSAAADVDALEMARVWIVGGKLQVSLKIGAWDNDPDVKEELQWVGIISNLIRFVSIALEESGLGTRREIALQLSEGVASSINPSG